jgi:hypothetical protein
MTMDWEAYFKEFDSLLRQFPDGALRSSRLGNKYVAFSPVVGDKFERGFGDGVRRLLVIGRAVNGWESGGGDTGDVGWIRQRMKEQLQRRKVIDRLEKESSRDWLCFARCMARVSAFWRTARQLLFEMNAGANLNESWPQYLGWTNLYKISPAAGGNPSDGECRAQFERCNRLLELELTAWSHVPVLVVAGYQWWKDFEGAWAFNGATGSRGFVEFKSAANGHLLIVAKHPERKKQPNYQDELIGAYRSLVSD